MDEMTGMKNPDAGANMDDRKLLEFRIGRWIEDAEVAKRKNGDGRFPAASFSDIAHSVAEMLLRIYDVKVKSELSCPDARSAAYLKGFEAGKEAADYAEGMADGRRAAREEAERRRPVEKCKAAPNKEKLPDLERRQKEFRDWMAKEHPGVDPFTSPLYPTPLMPLQYYEDMARGLDALMREQKRRQEEMFKVHPETQPICVGSPSTGSPLPDHTVVFCCSKN